MGNKICSLYKSAWEPIIVPNRLKYPEEAIGQKEFWCYENKVYRDDFEVMGSDENKIQATMFFSAKSAKAMPCVIYLHAKGGCRIETLPIQPILFQKEGMSLCCFDFRGSGHSEGHYLTLGIRESLDLKNVIKYIKKTYKVGPIIQWGRSMGAVTAIIYSCLHNSENEIIGLCLDSPFGECKEMIKDVITGHAKVPKCLLSCAIYCIAKTIKKKTGYDVLGINNYKHVPNIDIPLFMIVAYDDVLARPNRVKELYRTYKSSHKNLYLCEGTHPDMREDEVYVLTCSFIWNLFDTYSVKNENKSLNFDSMKLTNKINDSNFSNIDRMFSDVEKNVSPTDHNLTSTDSKSYELPTNLGEFLKYFEEESRKFESMDNDDCENYEYKPSKILPQKIKKTKSKINRIDSPQNKTLNNNSTRSLQNTNQYHTVNNNLQIIPMPSPTVLDPDLDNYNEHGLKRTDDIGNFNVDNDVQNGFKRYGNNENPLDNEYGSKRTDDIELPKNDRSQKNIYETCNDENLHGLKNYSYWEPNQKRNFSDEEKEAKNEQEDKVEIKTIKSKPSSKRKLYRKNLNKSHDTQPEDISQNILQRGFRPSKKHLLKSIYLRDSINVKRSSPNKESTPNNENKFNGSPFTSSYSFKEAQFKTN